MDIVPRMSCNERRGLARLGRMSGDPDTALRFLIVAHPAAGRNSPQVAIDSHVARSSVVRTAYRFASGGLQGLVDRRRGNGQREVTDAFRARVAEVLRRTPLDFGQMGPPFQRERNSGRHSLLTRVPSPSLARLAPSRRFGDPSLPLARARRRSWWETS